MARLNPHFRRFKEPVKALSGGQRQSVAIARAIHFNARVLIMDEPTAALGPAETQQVADLVLQLKKEGIGIFLISHDIHDVFDLADRVSVMKNGRLVGSAKVHGRDPGRGARHDHPRQVPARRHAGAGCELKVNVSRTARRRSGTVFDGTPSCSVPLRGTHAASDDERPVTGLKRGPHDPDHLRLPEGQNRSHHRRRERHRREHRGERSMRRAAGLRSSTTMRRPARRWPRELGERVHFEHADVRDIPALQAAIRRVSEALGPITILVNNAARDDRHTIDEVTPEYWRERFATNLDHQFFAAQAVLPDMEQGRRRLDHQHGLDELPGERRCLRGLQDRQIRRGRPDPRACPGARAQEHPRQLRRAGLDHDPAPDRPLAHPGGRGGAAQAPMREAQARAPGHRQLRPVPRPRTIPAPCRRRAIWWTAAGFSRPIRDMRVRPSTLHRTAGAAASAASLFSRAAAIVSRRTTRHRITSGMPMAAVAVNRSGIAVGVDHRAGRAADELARQGVERAEKRVLRGGEARRRSGPTCRRSAPSRRSPPRSCRC